MAVHIMLIKSYLHWQPILNAEDVFKDAITFAYTQADENGNVF